MTRWGRLGFGGYLFFWVARRHYLGPLPGQRDQSFVPRARFPQKPPHHAAQQSKTCSPGCWLRPGWPQSSKWQGQSFQQQLHRFWCACLRWGYANSIRHMWAKIQNPSRGPPLCVCSFTQANLAWERWRKHNIHRLYHVCCSYSAERQISKNPRNECLVNDTFRWSQSSHVTTRMQQWALEAL